MSEPRIEEVKLTPVEFAELAKRMRWDDRTIELLIKPPLHHKPFMVGDGKKGGKLVTLVENRAIGFRK